MDSFQILKKFPIFPHIHTHGTYIDISSTELYTSEYLKIVYKSQL